MKKNQEPGMGPKSMALLEQLGLDSIDKIRTLSWEKNMLLMAEHNPRYINANMAYVLMDAIQDKH
ncbi:MAG TPA: hypothetical protein PKC21_05735 [Oligoflexia bacterium]|nr:hypothetical protein [Oligoflexia bacterium]HMR24836.1 hypothetical protein [Oligoflexia bacterium]